MNFYSGSRQGGCVYLRKHLISAIDGTTTPSLGRSRMLLVSACFWFFCLSRPSLSLIFLLVSVLCLCFASFSSNSSFVLLTRFQDAEERLISPPIDGRFLVRRRTAEENAYVVSVVIDGVCYHNMVRLTVMIFCLLSSV